MAAIQNKQWTAEEYLAFERASEERHEFVDGKVRLMAGSNGNHSLIVGNSAAALGIQLRKRPCEAYLCQMRLRTVSGQYLYPDLTVVCDRPEFEDAETDTLLNPNLIVEVLSPSTEQFDRGKKFQQYRTLASLREYVLISQDAYRVEHYARHENNQWTLSDASGVEAGIELQSVGCRLALADVYDKVEFEQT